MNSKSLKLVGVCLATSQSKYFGTAVDTQPLSEREHSPKKLALLYDGRIIYYPILHNPTLQPIETVSATRLNLQPSDSDDCINRPR